MAELTPQEAEVLKHTADAVHAFTRLPPEHEADLPEFVLAIHAAQSIVLGRVGLRAQRDFHARPPR